MKTMNDFLKDFRIRSRIVFGHHRITYYGIELKLNLKIILCFCRINSFRFTISLAEPPNVRPLLNLCVPSIYNVENKAYSLEYKRLCCKGSEVLYSFSTFRGVYVQVALVQQQEHIHQVVERNYQMGNVVTLELLPCSAHFLS